MPDAFVRGIVGDSLMNQSVRSRERSDLEYKETFSMGSKAKYAKTMAAFANNHGGYILFGIRDTQRVIVGVNSAFSDFRQEIFTEYLNALFSPEIQWDVGSVQFEGFSIGYIVTAESDAKPVIALKNESAEKINSGDIFYRYRARNDKIKYPEMNQIIETRAKREREQILKLMEAIKKSGTTNLGIVNYDSGRFRMPNGVDIAVDRRIVTQILKKAKFIKQGSFDDNGGTPVLKVTGNIDLAEEVPVPDIVPDIQYPYLQKQLAGKLSITPNKLYALIWFYDMKGKKKYHMEVSTSASGKVHKFSDVALQFLAEKINENKEQENWMSGIYSKYVESKRKNGGNING